MWLRQLVLLLCSIALVVAGPTKISFTDEDGTHTFNVRGLKKREVGRLTIKNQSIYDNGRIVVAKLVKDDGGGFHVEDINANYKVTVPSGSVGSSVASSMASLDSSTDSDGDRTPRGSAEFPDVVVATKVLHEGGNQKSWGQRRSSSSSDDDDDVDVGSGQRLQSLRNQQQRLQSLKDQMISSSNDGSLHDSSGFATGYSHSGGHASEFSQGGSQRVHVSQVSGGGHGGGQRSSFRTSQSSHSGSGHPQSSMTSKAFAKDCGYVVRGAYGHNIRLNEMFKRRIAALSADLLRALNIPIQIQAMEEEYQKEKNVKADITSEDFITFVTTTYENAGRGNVHEVVAPLRVSARMAEYGRQLQEAVITERDLKKLREKSHLISEAREYLKKEKQIIDNMGAEGKAEKRKFIKYGLHRLVVYEGLLQIAGYCQTMERYSDIKLDALLNKLKFGEEEKEYFHMLCELRYAMGEAKRASSNHKLIKTVHEEQTKTIEKYVEDNASHYAAEHNRDADNVDVVLEELSAVTISVYDNLKSNGKATDELARHLKDVGEKLRSLNELLDKVSFHNDEATKISEELKELVKRQEGFKRWKSEELQKGLHSEDVMNDDYVQEAKNIKDREDDEVEKRRRVLKDRFHELGLGNHPQYYRDNEYPVLVENAIPNMSANDRQQKFASRDCVNVLRTFERKFAAVGEKISIDAKDLALTKKQYGQLRDYLFEVRVLKCLVLWDSKIVNPFFEYMNIMADIAFQCKLRLNDQNEFPGLELLSKGFQDVAFDCSNKANKDNFTMMSLCDLLYKLDAQGELTVIDEIPGLGIFLNNYFKHRKYAQETNKFSLADARRAGEEFVRNRSSSHRSSSSATYHTVGNFRKLKSGKSKSRRTRSSKHRSRKGRSNKSRNKRARKH